MNKEKQEENNQVPEEVEEELTIPDQKKVSIEVRDVNDFLGFDEFQDTIKETLEGLGF